MFTTSLAVFLALLFIFAKLPRRLMLRLLRLLRYDLAIDAFVTLFVLVVHWGTFQGVMGATIAGLLTSTATSTAKRLFGFIRGADYVPGTIRLKI